MTDILTTLGWLVLGVGVGAYGTLIGAGGGFILVPVLLLLYPGAPASQITAVSLAVVFANAASGSYRYYRLRRVDYQSGVVLALATVPGAVLGAITVGYIPRRAFDVFMGVTLLLVAGYLLLRPAGLKPLWLNSRFTVSRRLADSDGDAYEYQFNLLLAALFSVLVGFLSSLLGIGGGIIHVPLLTSFFGFPAHLATATSHFILMFTAAAGTATHVFESDYRSFLGVTIELAIGVILGAQVGAALSGRIGGPLIIRLLAVALGIVGLRLLIVGA